MRLLLVLFPCFFLPGSGYEQIKSSVLKHRNEWSNLYSVSGTAVKDSLVLVARKYLLKTIARDILPAWYGTPWDFNGTTETPRQGTIACGYFVMTVLRDAGFKIPRVAWSQSASEPVIKKICSRIKRFHDAPLGKVESWLQESGEGLYVVGLDCHVGFIVKYGRKTLFVHSSYYHPGTGVMAESLHAESPFRHSSYRVIGKLLDNAMIEGWLSGKAWE